MCSSLSVRPVDQQWRQLAVRFYSKWYRVTSGVSELARRIRLGEQNLILHTIIFVGLKTNTGELLFEYFQQHRLQHNWCFVTCKKNIGQWVVVHNRVVETWDSKGARGGSYNTPTYIPAYTIKNNKLHEGVQWSQHTKDFYYIQAWDEFLSYEFFTR